MFFYFFGLAYYIFSDELSLSLVSIDNYKNYLKPTIKNHMKYIFSLLYDKNNIKNLGYYK